MNTSLSKVAETGSQLINTIGEFFVSDPVLLQKVVAAALANGHILFEDNPGLGKTLLAKTFAKATGCGYRRIQFTPDLMPSDIVGTKVWVAGKGAFEVERGPVFTNILLSDEINRSPPKVQSALLECMEERQVTIEGETLPLGQPFFVLATQNPIELEGTYPLPEAQLDRFLLKLSTGYARTLEDEALILRRRLDWQRDDPVSKVEKVTSAEELRGLQEAVERGVYVDEQILLYISRIVRLTRENPFVSIGSSPRGGLSLLKAAKANAALSGRDYVIPDDVKLYALDVLPHRMIMKMEYTFEKQISPAAVVQEILGKVEVPRDVARR